MSPVPGERDRPYDTSEPESLGSVLSSLFALRGYGRSQGDKQLQDQWKKIVDAEIASKTKVLSLRAGILQIGVANSSLLSELASFHKLELLDRIRESGEFGRIKDLRFKLRRDIK
ncbi:DUF721 domain-containing protein [Planctomicrobium sp. SH527]|uniref:DUF721 domain-containing protein n=1 Tax=Planctomicrobium sp. SH527 TaxID=3448123 RepID=UPI003F5C7151